MKVAILVLCLCSSSLFISGCVDVLDVASEDSEKISFSATLDVFVKESDNGY